MFGISILIYQSKKQYAANVVWKIYFLSPKIVAPWKTNEDLKNSGFNDEILAKKTMCHIWYK